MPRSRIVTASLTAWLRLGTLAIGIAIPASALAQFGVYDPGLGTLPSDQGWNLTQIGVNPAPTVAQGILHQGPTSFAGYQFWSRTGLVSDFTSTDGFVLQLELQVNNSTYEAQSNTWRSGYEVAVSDSSRYSFGLGITETGIRLSNDRDDLNDNSTAFIPMNTTAGFHSYRIAANPFGLSLSVDNVLISTLPLGTPAPYESNFAYFADGTGSGSSDTLLRSLQWGQLGVPIESAGPTDNASTSGVRLDPGGSGPATTISYNSMSIFGGGSYSLGSNETLNLNDGQGTLYVYSGATFIGNGTVQGNILNSGLVIVPITRSGAINLTSGGIVRMDVPAAGVPGVPVVIPPPSLDIPIQVNDDTFVVIGSAGTFGAGGAGGGGGGEGAPGHYQITGPGLGNAGTLAWDARLDVTGDFTQTSTGVLREYIAGNNQGATYSFLNVDQHVALDGILQLVLRPELFDYLPDSGDAFDVIHGGQGISFPNGTITLQTLVTSGGVTSLLAKFPLLADALTPFATPFAGDPDDLFLIDPTLFSYSLVDDGHTLRVAMFAPVPEPASWVLLLLGSSAAAICLLRRRRSLPVRRAVSR